MKRWTPEHVRLAVAVEQVRGRLRAVAGRLADPERTQILECAASLSNGLKARTVHERVTYADRVKVTSTPTPSNDLLTRLPEGRHIAPKAQLQGAK